MKSALLQNSNNFENNHSSLTSGDELRSEDLIKEIFEAQEETREIREKLDKKNVIPSYQDTALVDPAETQQVVSLPIIEKRPSQIKNFISLQEWEGYVTDIGSEEFTARLLDLTQNDDYEKEEADFLIEDLSDYDRSLLKIGSVFRWVIGYQVARSGSKQRISKIVMRRLPQWTQKDLDESDAVALEKSKHLRWE